MRKYRKDSGNRNSKISLIKPVDKDLKNKEIGDELEKFIDLITKYDFCIDGTMQKAGGMCSKLANETQWAYNGYITFNIDTVGSSHPIDLKNLRLVFTINIKAEEINSSSVCDPLNYLDFDIEIFGTSDTKGDIICCWHLDRNKHVNANADHYSHPKYHLTFGGDKLPENGDYGNLIILPSPRIAHPPMDAILGIDFIIQNYIDVAKTKILLNDSIYKDIIEKSQKRLWKSYFHSIAAKWDFRSEKYDKQYDYNKLLPFIV